MATVWIRPAGGSYGLEDGSDYDNAFAGAAARTGITAGDTVYVCGGVHTEEFTITEQGSSGNPITWRGDASKIDANYVDGSFDGQSAVQFAFDHGSGRDYNTYKYFSCTGMTRGFLRMINTASSSCQGLIVEYNRISNSGQDGIVINTTVNNVLACDFIIRNNVITDSSGAGILVQTAVSQGEIYGNIVDGWGSDDSLNRWGIYATPRYTLYNSGWTLSGGTVYSQAVADTVVVAQSASATTAYDYPLRNAGATTTPALGEFGQTGGSVYVNIGEDPNNKTTYLTFTETKNIKMYGNQVRNWNGTTADGVGIGFDQNVINCDSFSNLSENNGNGLSFNKNIDCRSYGNIAQNNDEMGIKLYRARNTHVCNNSSINNGTRQYDVEDIQDAVQSCKLQGNVAIGGTHGAVLTVVTGLSEDYNTSYNNSVASGFVGGDSIGSLTNPLDSNNVPVKDGDAYSNSTKWWVGANPDGYGTEPFMDYDTDRGAIQSIYSPFHPKQI